MNQRKVAEGFIKKADGLSRIQAEGAVPFRLEARIEILVSGEKKAEGQYLTVWQSPTRWRDELTIPGYRQIRFGTEKGFWRSSSPPHQTVLAAQFYQSMLASGPPPAFDSKKIRVALSEHGRAQMNCVMLDFGSEMKDTRNKCFDSVSGLLFRETWNDWDTVWEYTDYAPWGDKIFPRFMRILHGGKPVAVIQVTKLEANPAIIPSAFDRPADSEAWPQCGVAVGPPRKLYQNLTKLGASGWIYDEPAALFLELGADGKVYDVVVVYPENVSESKRHQLVDNLKAAWKFKPPKCGKTPIPVSMTMDVTTMVGIVR